MTTILPPAGRKIVRSGDWTVARRIALLTLFFSLLTPRLVVDTLPFHIDIGVAAAFADEGDGGDGEGGDGGDGEGGEGGEGDSGDGDGDGESGEDGDGGEDGGSDDGGEDGGGDDNDHGATGSSVKGFLGALFSHGKVQSAIVAETMVSVVYADGWSERVVDGRYQLIDRKSRIVVSRKARPMDLRRLRAAAGV